MDVNRNSTCCARVQTKRSPTRFSSGLGEKSSDRLVWSRAQGAMLGTKSTKHGNVSSYAGKGLCIRVWFRVWRSRRLMSLFALQTSTEWAEMN